LLKNIHQNLSTKYPNSFSHKFYPETEKYRQLCQEKYNFFNPTNHPNFEADDNLNEIELKKSKEIPIVSVPGR
jgi:hypothetical protein